MNAIPVLSFPFAEVDFPEAFILVKRQVESVSYFRCRVPRSLQVAAVNPCWHIAWPLSGKCCDCFSALMGQRHIELTDTGVFRHFGCAVSQEDEWKRQALHSVRKIGCDDQVHRNLDELIRCAETVAGDASQCSSEVPEAGRSQEHCCH